MKGFSGADIAALIQNAQMIALRELYISIEKTEKEKEEREKENNIGSSYNRDSTQETYAENMMFRKHKEQLQQAGQNRKKLSLELTKANLGAALDDMLKARETRKNLKEHSKRRTSE